MPLPEPVQQLIGALNKLPGIGPRSAERIALHIVQSDPGVVRQLAQTIAEVRDRIRTCPICGALTEQTPCAICADSRRDAALSVWSSGLWTSSASKSRPVFAANFTCWAERFRP